MTLKMPVGVGRSGVPVETGDLATATPPSYKVTVCLAIETVSSNGPCVGGAGGALSRSWAIFCLRRSPWLRLGLGVFGTTPSTR